MGAARRFDVVAAFPDGARARSAVAALTRKGITEGNVRVVGPGDDDPVRVGEMRAEMQEEVSEGFAGPAVGFMTPSQGKGALAGVVTGTVVGLILGAVVGAIWGVAFESELSTVGRIAVAAICFAFAGGTIGVIAGGAVKPRMDAAEHPSATLDQRRLEGERDTLVAVHIDGGMQPDVVRKVLEDSGASRVDSIDNAGDPMPPQSDQPRPADPPGWWSGNGRGKG